MPTGSFFVYSVRRGSCRLILNERDQPLELYEGDTVVLPQCKEHQLQDAGTSIGMRTPHVQWFDPHRGRDSSSTRACLQTSTTLLISRFRKPARQSDLLLAAFPPYIIHRAAESESSHCVESTLALLEIEIAKQLSDRRIIEHLTKVLILQVSRNSLLQSANGQCGTEALTIDDVIRRALGLMHARPDISWTVATLATAVGISRSTFAARFAERMEETPLSYLRRERMKQAAELLADETLGIKEIAALVGYDSESAFSNAFKLVRNDAWNVSSREAPSGLTLSLSNFMQSDRLLAASPEFLICKTAQVLRGCIDARSSWQILEDSLDQLIQQIVCGLAHTRRLIRTIRRLFTLRQRFK